jgi:hypothetical protein
MPVVSIIASTIFLYLGYLCIESMERNSLIKLGFTKNYADFIENITYGDVDTGVECSLIVLSLFVKGDSFVPIIQEGDAQERKGRFIAGVSQICEEFLVASDFSFGLVVVAIEEESEECRK